MTLLIDTCANISVALLTIGIALSTYRLIRGPNMPDRAVALDLIAILCVGIMAVYTIAKNDAAYLPAGMAVALMAFIGTVAFAQYLRHGGDSD